jgi:hypothetical protein
MPGNNASPQFTDWMENMERRMRELETSQRQRRTGQVGGTYKVLDGDPDVEAGVERIEIGEIVHPFTDPVDQTDFGMIVRADSAAGNDNQPVFMVDSGGPLIPGDKGFIQALNATEERSHASTSFTGGYAIWFVGVLGRVISMQLQIRVGTGITVAEAQLDTFNLNSGNATSDAIALTADNVYNTYTWHWNPAGDLDPNDVWGVRIDTRVVTGAGTIDVAKPRWCVQRSAVAVDTNVTGT